MKKHDDSTYVHYGMIGYQICTCPAPKYFANFNQASLKGKGKRIETHAIESALTLTTTKVNNALVKRDPTTPVET